MLNIQQSRYNTNIFLALTQLNNIEDNEFSRSLRTISLHALANRFLVIWRYYMRFLFHRLDGTEPTISCFFSFAFHRHCKCVPFACR